MCKPARHNTLQTTEFLERRSALFLFCLSLWKTIYLHRWSFFHYADCHPFIARKQTETLYIKIVGYSGKCYLRFVCSYNCFSFYFDIDVHRPQFSIVSAERTPPLLRQNLIETAIFPHRLARFIRQCLQQKFDIGLPRMSLRQLDVLPAPRCCAAYYWGEISTIHASDHATPNIWLDCAIELERR